MKKLILAGLIAVFAFASVPAFAQGGNHWGGKNHGNHWSGKSHWGGGCGGCVGGGFGGQFSNNMTEDQAKAAVEAYVAQYFKGYELGRISTDQTPRGSYFMMDAKDASGNMFSFFVSPCGNVRGPMPVQ